MIIDACLVNFEYDMLELRLRTLDPVVDRFIVCSADVSHSGEDQVLCRPDLEPRFAPWRHKMQPVAVTDVPRFWVNGDLEVCQACQHIWGSHTARCWHVTMDGICPCTASRPYHRSIPRTPYFQKRERHQRDAIARIKLDSSYQGDDLVFVSDVDEIWDPESLGRIEHAVSEAGWVCLEQRMHGFALDYLHPNQPWLGTTVSYLADLAPQAMRDARGTAAMQHLKYGGIHLSWLGSEEERDRKLASFSHGELVGKINPSHLYREGKHSNGELLERIDFPGDWWWPKPLSNGEFCIPSGWLRPR